MANLVLNGINEAEILNTALFEYRLALLRAGNGFRATVVSDMMKRICYCDCGSNSDCKNCVLFLNFIK